MQDHLFTTKHRILTWKPPAPAAFKINVDAYHSTDRTVAVGAAVLRDAQFKWFLGITRRIVSRVVHAGSLVTYS